MAYRAIFFDIDDTLLNFGQSGKEALKRTFADYDLPWNEHTHERFNQLNQQLWQQQKQGLLKVHEVIDTRFGLFFEAMNWQHLDADSFTLQHQQHLSQQSALEPYALEVVQQVSHSHDIFAASNSILALQTARLSQAQLLPYFSDLFISSEVGYEKPNPRFFETCLERSGLQADEVLFVGDSIEADMAGALGSGMHMCWYNRKQENQPSHLQATYEIDDLRQLFDCLG